MKGAGRQVVAVLTATALLAVSGHTTAYAGIKETEQKLNEAKEEKKKTEEAIGDTKEEISSLQGTVAGLQQQLSGLNEDLEEVSNNLAELENRITQKEEEITQTQAELEEAKQIEADQYAAMKKRIQFMYEKRDYVMLEVLFGSADFADLLNRNDYFEQLSAYDRKKLTEFQETRAAVEDKEAALLQEKEDLDDLKVKVEAEQSKVSGLVSQTTGAISANQHLVSEAEKEMLAYEQQLAEQNNNIAELQKQLEEAGNQPYAGQVAVGAVVINRVKSAVFPDTVVGVIYQNKQFSPVASGRLALALAENHATAACYKAADEAMGGATTVGDCLFFRTPIDGLTGTQIGGHIFY